MRTEPKKDAFSKPQASKTLEAYLTVVCFSTSDSGCQVVLVERNKMRVLVIL